VTPRRCEAIWVAADAFDADIIEPLTHLVAAAVARDTGRPVAIYTVADPPSFLVWRGDDFASAGAAPPLMLSSLCTALADVLGLSPKTHRYVFFVNPGSPRTPPSLPPDEVFDRVVFVTRALPTRVPPDFEQVLHDFPAHFSSFVASVLVQKSRTFSAVSAALAGILSRGAASFGVRRVRDEDPTQGAVAEFSSEELIARDACNLRIDRTALKQKWKTWDQTSSFFDAVDGDATVSSHARTAEVWGRAITNRRVGIAVSGGGACGYRSIPLVAECTNQGVPIDAFAGLSGGALAAAYYCCLGESGFDIYEQLGPFFSLTLPSVMYTTWPVAFVTNLMLDGERIETLERRFVPVTTGLPPDDKPFAAVVVSGTVGDGVRASGSLPPGFGPTAQDGVRYTDGGNAALLPVEILRDYGGADAVLACDISPGPKHGNPLGASWLAKLVHDYTLCGRLLDLWADLAFFSQRANSSFAKNADAFAVFPPEDIPLVESIMFFDAHRIIAKAAAAKPMLHNAVATLKAAWERL
jgi:predicted acylesterase/phospholipase RssA